MSRAKKAVRRVLAAAGWDIRRIGTPAKSFLFESDGAFTEIYRRGLQATGSGLDPEVVPQRLYNAVQFLRHTADLEGETAECGAFLGLSSFVFCHHLLLSRPQFRGEGYHIFDSFEGLSTPGAEDLIIDGTYGSVGTSTRPEGAFAGALDRVKLALRDFPLIEYHVGWIPAAFAGLPEKRYRFVHLDLDLYQPIKGAIEYSYPRLVTGGVVVVDEYALPRWPGAQKAVDEYCHAHSLAAPVALTTGNGLLIKK